MGGKTKEHKLTKLRDYNRGSELDKTGGSLPSMFKSMSSDVFKIKKNKSKKDKNNLVTFQDDSQTTPALTPTPMTQEEQKIDEFDSEDS